MVSVSIVSPASPPTSHLTRSPRNARSRSLPPFVTPMLALQMAKAESRAMNRQWTDSDKQVHEETDWMSIVIWNKENLATYLTKGARLYVEGRLQTRSYDDKEGVKRYVTEVVAENLGTPARVPPGHAGLRSNRHPRVSRFAKIARPPFQARPVYGTRCSLWLGRSLYPCSPSCTRSPFASCTTPDDRP